jgi:hypothetical protein
VEAIPKLEEKTSKIQYLKIEPQTELMGEEIGTIEQNINIEPLISI